MAPLVGAGVSQPANTSETIDERGGNDAAMIISSAGFMTTPTFSFDYTPLPSGATLSTIEGATFTQLSPFSSTSEVVHLTRGAHHRKVFLRFVACDGSDVGASLPKSTTSISTSSTTHHDHNHNVDVRKAQSHPFWKPLPNCTSKVVLGASHDEEAGHRRTTAAKRARDDNDDGLLNGGGGGGGGDDNMSSTGMFGGSFDVAPPAAAAGSKSSSLVGSSSTSDRAEKQRQELLQFQRELEEARETARANAALKK
ncbi:Hypothetical protein, putative [Bodo saltans]|uniref:Uncharacterized protein n=1 Tax=Bodo saltans TaxID=75058 RepID=A0A0S4JL26_BODSA|nr:Hypothetical protein, putative [Bodo saltans]|eukprot:CUG92228.1 Hypothetical protein, putative [Bodo saltans]